MDKERITLLFASFLVLLSCCLQFSQAASSTITIGQTINVSSTISSAGNEFEMGFYSPSNTTNYYLGIWYKKVSLQTIVWTANSDYPFSSSSVSLTIGEDGNLVIADGKIRYVVSSTVATGNTSATLLDSGNLVLRDENSNVLWQSFEFPTDTFLPGMKIGFDRMNGRNWSLVSWRSLNDPAPGDYYMIPDPNGTSQIFIMKGPLIYWTSGAWNGMIFSLVPEMTSNNLYNFTYVSNEKEFYFTYSLYNKSIISRLSMDVSGQVKQSTWLEAEKQWMLFLSQPRIQCEVYDYCGAFATCNKEPRETFCACLRGFEPRNPSDWARGSYSQGCTRKADLQCNNSTTPAAVTASPDKFIATPNSLAANPLLKDAQSVQDCESSCSKNCRCTAFAYSNFNCSTWEGNLVNLQQNSDTSRPDLYVRLAASEFSTGSGAETSGRKSKKLLWIMISSVSPILFLALYALLCWLRKRKHREKGEDLLSFDFNVIHGASKYELTKEAMATSRAGKEVDIPLFSLSSVSAATNDFSSPNKLGEGGFGPVYKGKLLNGYEVAVKRLSRRSGQGWEELKNEAMLIGKLQHKNLVKLLGCCIEGDEKILVYEYLPNKSLDLFLFGPSKHEPLDWSNRVRIVEGIAQGLLYLHQFSRVQIIHRDLKASNILLDQDMNPKISDFGMARIFGGKDSQATNRIVGTYGYMSPEYALQGIFSVKSDVFSFGVLLLEILTGKKNTGSYHSDSLNLLGYTWDLWRSGKCQEIMDQELDISVNSALRYINIALLCVEEHAYDRPTMSDVVSMLSNEGVNLACPKQPAFSNAQGLLNPSPSGGGEKVFSVNSLSVSVAEGR